MRIHAPELIVCDDRARIQARLDFADQDYALWYEVDRAYAGFLVTERADAFLVGALLKAMGLGEDIEVNAPVSARLLYNLQNYYQRILQLQIPSLQAVRICAAEVTEAALTTTEHAVGTGFSAGIDSFAVVHDHYYSEVPAGYRLSHFLFCNVGSHGDRDSAAASRLFEQRYQLVKGYPGTLGLPLIRLDSNLSDLLMMNFEQTHVPRNLSAVLTLQKLFRRYYYASTFRYQDCFIGPANDAAYCDPAAIHLLSTENTELVSTGAQYSRVEKTRRVAQLPQAATYLSVCTNIAAQGNNCSRCTKCTRTLFTLEMLSRLDTFAGCFDLATWARIRNRYVSGWLLQPNRPPLTREMVEYANETGYRFTTWQRFMAMVLRYTPRLVHKLLASIRRRYFD